MEIDFFVKSPDFQKYLLLQHQITLSQKYFWIVFLFTIESSRSENAKNGIVHPLTPSGPRELVIRNFRFFGDFSYFKLIGTPALRSKK